MSFEVICAGLSRTGTLTLKTALETLGYSPCWHIEDMVKGANTANSPLDVWSGLAHGRGLAPVARQLSGGKRAFCSPGTTAK